jgi:hypothetical protein
VDNEEKIFCLLGSLSAHAYKKIRRVFEFGIVGQGTAIPVIKQYKDF